jgi:methionine-R-sulfoxide reductase
MTKNDNKTEFSQRQIVKTDEEWRAELTPEQYQILRHAGTERAFTGQFWNHHDNGAYTCAGCGTELFRSDSKFDSHCGWPSFFEAADDSKVERRVDNSYGMRRVEVLCRACGGHLGHVFDDGPLPTGERFCINSASLNFHKAD